MVKCKFTVSHHGHRFQLLFNIRSEKAVLFLLDYLFVVDLNGPVFVYKLFWSDLIVKVSFIAWASGDGPFALARSHGNCAQHRENERFLLSKPWIWMATPALLICIYFSPYVPTPMLYKCLCVYAFFTQRFFVSSSSKWMMAVQHNFTHGYTLSSKGYNIHCFECLN